MCCSAPPIDVGYRNERRWTIVPSRAELPSGDVAEPAVVLGRESVIVVTGGARASQRSWRANWPKEAVER